MKRLLIAETALIIVTDMILVSIAIISSMGQAIFCLAIVNLVLGPLQFIPALIMVFNRNNRTSFFIVYFIISIVIIIITCILLNNLDTTMGQIETIFILMYVMIFSWIIAHYFLYVLRRINNSSPQ